MLTIDLGTIEYYDSDSNQFVYEKGGIARFEYSLKVVYDWESKWRKPFLKGGLTDKEAVDFYMMMALDHIDEKFLTSDVMELLSNYIVDPNTATTFSSPEGQNGNQTFNAGKTYTSEEIYALMFEAQIPLEWENRNLNRLMVILRIISLHNNPPEKMSEAEVLKRNKELNAQRRAQFKTKG